MKQVVEGGPAEQAGLKTGDRLVAVNGLPVTDKPYSEVIQYIQKSPDYLHLLVISKEEDILQKVCFFGIFYRGITKGVMKKRTLNSNLQ